MKLLFHLDSQTLLTIPLIILSTLSLSTGLFLRAICTDLSSLSRSNGTFLPDFLRTVSSLNCIRSNVVKRAPHAEQNLLLLMAELSSVARESLTWVSLFPQNGHFHIVT